MARTKRARRGRAVRHRKFGRPKGPIKDSAKRLRPDKVYDAEGILVDKILESATIPENGTSIENLIYNATPKVAEIGYGYGFSVGRELCMKQGAKQRFTEVLDRIGLPNALYYPLKDSLIVTSGPAAKRPRPIGKAVHVYEAGVISGYLSMSTGLKISTIEKRCTYNGAGVCQFVSAPMSSRPQQAGIELKDVIEGIARTITDNDFKKLGNEYYRIIACLPLMQQPMQEQVRKLLVMSGAKIAEYSDKKDPRTIINNIINYFGAKGTEISLRNRGKSIIKLRYESYNSIYPYISMPTAMIVGFVSSAFNKKAEVSISTNRDKTYTTTIGFKNNSA